MEISVYVDGAGGEKSGYGFFIKETGESFYEEKLGITNNQAEYNAIIVALKKFQGSTDNEQLRILAQESWLLIPKIPKLKIKWIPRKENLAGKMLGS